MTKYAKVRLANMTELEEKKKKGLVADDKCVLLSTCIIPKLELEEM